jgi:hypothetical protein
VNRAETATVLAYATEVWPRMQIGDNAVNVWANACHHLDAMDAVTAIESLAQRMTWPPVPAELIAEVNNLTRRRDPETTSRQLDAGPPENTSGRMGRMKRAWLDALAARPECNHKQPDTPCPRCTTRWDFLGSHPTSKTGQLGDRIASETR